MRVAIDAGPLYGHRTGVGVAAGGIIEALAGRGDVTLSPYLVSGRSTPMAGHRRLPIPGIVASHLWSRTDHPRADRWLRGADLVHGTNYVAPPTRLPTVVSVYDCWFLRHPELAAPLVRRAGDNLLRAVARGAWVHGSSEATAADVRDLLDTDRVVVIPLGPPNATANVDAPPRAVDGLREQRYVVSIGTEERRKGLPLLIDAFARLADDERDLVLVLAGSSGDDSTAVSAAIERLPDAGRVRRLGPIDERAKAWLLHNAAALAYPSLDEGFGFPILEGQAAGTPVVATAAGSIPEVAGDGAVLVPDRTTDAFAAGLHAALADAGRVTLVEAGFRNLKRFDWTATADALVDLYRRAAEDTP